MLIINVMNRFKSLKIFTVASHSSPADFFHELETDRFLDEWDKVRVVNGGCWHELSWLANSNKTKMCCGSTRRKEKRSERSEQKISKIRQTLLGTNKTPKVKRLRLTENRNITDQ